MHNNVIVIERCASCFATLMLGILVVAPQGNFDRAAPQGNFVTSTGQLGLRGSAGLVGLDNSDHLAFRRLLNWRL